MQAAADQISEGNSGDGGGGDKGNGGSGGGGAAGNSTRRDFIETVAPFTLRHLPYLAVSVQEAEFDTGTREDDAIESLETQGAQARVNHRGAVFRWLDVDDSLHGLQAATATGGGVGGGWSSLIVVMCLIPTFTGWG